MAIPGLCDHQSEMLQAVRKDLRTDTVTVWTETQATGAGLGVYGPNTVTSGSHSLLASVGWERTVRRDIQAGGVRELGNCTVVFDIEDKAHIHADDTYLVFGSHKLYVVETQELPESGELVAICRRSKTVG